MIMPANASMLAGLAALLLSASVSAASLQSLDDASLSGVVGQEGIAMDLGLYLNTDTNGDPLAALDNCKGTSKCNIALQFNNRLNAGGEWLVLKDVSASIRLKSLLINAAFSSATASKYADSSRFANAGKTLCIPSGAAYSATTCAGSVLDKPVLQFSYKGDAATFETDTEMFVSIGRMAVQYGANGPSTDQNGSFMGVLVSDLTQRHAKIDFDGKVFVSGF